jgi:hypothetical protein
LGQHACFEHLEDDVTRRLVAARCGATTADMMTFKPDEALGGVAEPRAAADVAIAARVPVAEKIETRPRLIGEVGGNGVAVLLAEADLGHRQRERATFKVFDKPLRARQRTRDGGQQRAILRNCQHVPLR